MDVAVEAVVLSVRPLGEGDRRLSLFSRERGRIYARAAGVGKPASRLAAVCRPLSRARWRLWLPTENAVAGRVTGGLLMASYPELRRRWDRWTTGVFWAEWTNKLTAPGHPQPEKYDLLTRALSALENPRFPAPLLRAVFLAQFLRLAGLGPDPAAVAPGLSPEPFINWDFFSPPPEAAPTSLRQWEERLIQSAAPSLPGPLRTLDHARRLADFHRRWATA
jgi:DNA repair protein RecO